MLAGPDRLTECVEATTALLRGVPQRAASGLAAAQLRRRAAALCAMGRPAEALQDLDEADRLQPGDPATLLLRAQARAAALPSVLTFLAQAMMPPVRARSRLFSAAPCASSTACPA